MKMHLSLSVVCRPKSSNAAATVHIVSGSLFPADLPVQTFFSSPCLAWNDLGGRPSARLHRRHQRIARA